MLLTFTWVCLLETKTKNWISNRFHDYAICFHSVLLTACFIHSKGLALALRSMWKQHVDLRKLLSEQLLSEYCHFGACNFIIKETLTQVFSYEFCHISKNTFFTEHLRTTAPIHCDIHKVFSLLYFQNFEV